MTSRKQLRLKGYDYRRANAYFITICCHQHRHLFGHISDGKMHLNAYGQFAHAQWLALANAYPHIDLGEFIIMPNHMHGVIYVGEWDGRADGAGGWRDGGDEAGGGEPLPYRKIDDGAVREGLAPSRRFAPSRSDAPSLSAIIGAYKSLTYRDCLTLAKANNERLGKLWHRSFHEIIIQTPEAARRIRHYIRNNVRTWARDKFRGK